MKLPEPIAYKHYARKKPELSVLSWASRPTERQIATGFVTEALLTEAQCKQAVRDALEAAAKVCDARHHATTDGAAAAIRRLQEGL